MVTDSLAFTDGTHQHVFEDTRDWMDEVFWARIYAGFHFYHSLEVGRQLGESVAQGVVKTTSARGERPLGQPRECRSRSPFCHLCPRKLGSLDFRLRRTQVPRGPQCATRKRRRRSAA